MKNLISILIAVIRFVAPEFWECGCELDDRMARPEHKKYRYKKVDGIEYRYCWRCDGYMDKEGGLIVRCTQTDLSRKEVEK